MNGSTPLLSSPSDLESFHHDEGHRSSGCFASADTPKCRILLATFLVFLGCALVLTLALVLLIPSNSSNASSHAPSCLLTSSSSTYKSASFSSSSSSRLKTTQPKQSQSFFKSLFSLSSSSSSTFSSSFSSSAPLPSATNASSSSAYPSFAVVESIPYGVELSWPAAAPAQPSSVDVYQHSTAAAWSALIRGAQRSIDLVCFYMTLNATDDGSVVDSSPEGAVLSGHDVGMGIYQDLIDAGARGVRIRIVVSYPSTTVNNPPLDVQRLVQRGVAEARMLNMTAVDGSGIVHTKLMLFDGLRLYTGSANLDWRSLTQVKELGVVLSAPCLLADAQRQFELYWATAAASALPAQQQPYAAFFNAESPARVPFLATGPSPPAPSAVYFTSSPRWFCPPGRTFDLSAILGMIGDARSTLALSVMDYIPATMYSSPNYYWPDIDDALRAAAFNGVQVRLLFALWNYTNPLEPPYWASLDALDNITVKVMWLPLQQDAPYVPFTRVNHCKYLISESQVLVTTSNWSADYFIDTTGLSAVSNDQVMTQQIQAVFDRDWDSDYAFDLNQFPF